MDNYRRNNRSGGRGNSGGFNRNSERPTMHKAICTDCGSNCEVPFKPSGDKPILCSECFGNKRSSEPRRDSGRFDRRDSRGGGSRDSRGGSRDFGRGDKRMHQVVCDNCHKNCEVPFKPTSDKPIYCSECFSKGDKSKGSSQQNKGLDAINTKLDEILKLLGSTAPVKAEKKVVIAPKPEVEKKVVTVSKPEVEKKVNKKATVSKPKAVKKVATPKKKVVAVKKKKVVKKK